jgi:hypothetical protein
MYETTGGGFTLYGTEELIIVQQRFPVLPDGFWMKIANRTITSDREEILFERLDIDNRRLAPFVAPNVQGRVMRAQGFSARTFRPAYVKPKHIVDPQKAIPRMFGEPLLGGLTMRQRFDARVADNMRLEKEMIQRRWDWMAAAAIRDGSVTVSGDDYPTVVVDFLREPSLTIQLSGTATWNNVSTANPLSDIDSALESAFQYGLAPITDLVFGTAAWKNFTQNSQVYELLNRFYRGTESDFDRSGVMPQNNFQQVGRISGANGSLALWRYKNWYSDVGPDGKLTQMQYLDDTDVVGFGPAVDMVACYGAIQDVDAGFVAQADIFPKMWKNEDPSVVYTMSQSAPLFVPTNPNNTFKIITE